MFDGQDATHEQQREPPRLRGPRETWANRNGLANDNQHSGGKQTDPSMFREDFFALPALFFRFMEEVQVLLGEVWSMVGIEDQHARSA